MTIIQNKKSFPIVLIIKIICFFIFTACLLVFIFIPFGKSGGSENFYDAENISGTNFKIYKNKVLVTIPSGGNFLVVDADFNSISAIESKGYVPQLAKDKNHVFCGNKILPNLDPNTIIASFDGYIADKYIAYYCDRPKLNPDITFIDEIIKINKTALDADKPQTYYNEIIKLDTKQPSKLLYINHDYATDGQFIYYKGKLIQAADSATISTMIEITPTRTNNNRTSIYYIKDKYHVYYQGKLVPNASPQTAIIYNLEGSAIDYLYDQSIDLFYVGDTAFPRVITPQTSEQNEIIRKIKQDQLPLHLPNEYKITQLQFLNVSQNHAYHDLLFNKYGIFYWETKTQKLTIACPAPFDTQQLKMLSNGFVADTQNSYFLQAAENWNNGRFNKGLNNRQTHLIKINHISYQNWQKIETRQDGVIWFADGEYYFESKSTTGNFFDSTLYKIKDIKRLNLQPKLTYQNKTDYLMPIKGELVCIAKTDYNTGWW